jgi:hypothetical protein
MFDNPLSALAGAPPEPQQPAQQGTPAPINETAAPQQPEPMKPGVAPTQTFTNAPKQSLWMNVVQGALQGLAASGGATSFGGGLGRGAAGQMAAQRQQVMDEEEIKFKNQQAAAAASVAARQNFELTKLKQDAKIAADNHSIGLINWYSKTFGYVPAWVSDDDSESAMAGLKHLSKSHEGGVPSVFTLHLNDAGEKGKIVGFTLPPPDQQLNFVNYARKAEGVPKLTEQQWRALDGDKQEQYIHNANNLWFPSDLSEDKLPGAIARYKGLRETYVQRGDGTTPEERSEVAQKFDDVIGMLQAIQGDHVTRKLDLKKRETEITESTKAKYKTSDDHAPSSHIPQGATGENVLANLSAPMRESIKGLADYKVDPATFPARTGHGSNQMDRATAIGMAKAFDPSFDETQYKSRAAVRKDFTSGKAAFNIRSLNTAIGHLDAFAKAGAELQNGSVQLWNRIANSTLNATGDPRVAKFLAAADAVSGEAATIFKGTSGTDQEIKAWREHLSSASSPEQIKATTEQLIELMASRLEALDGQYQSGMGKPRDFRFLNDKSAGILQKLGATHMIELDRAGARMEQGGQSQNDGTIRVQASDGSFHRIPKDKLSAVQQKDPGAKVVN